MSYAGSPVKGQGPGEGEERHARHKVIEKLRFGRKSVPLWNDEHDLFLWGI